MPFFFAYRALTKAPTAERESFTHKCKFLSIVVNGVSFFLLSTKRRLSAAICSTIGKLFVNLVGFNSFAIVQKNSICAGFQCCTANAQPAQPWQKANFTCLLMYLLSYLPALVDY